MIDRATIVGLIATFVLIACVVADGSGLGASSFWHGSAAALVFGGAVFTTLMAFSWQRFWSMGGVLGHVLRVHTRQHEELIATLVAFAHTARRDGLLSLEKPTEELQDDFLKRIMRLAVDGADARTIEQVGKTELESTDARHASGCSLIETIGKSAPVFGMMGTVIGLIIMLGRLNDPSRIGPGMSTALLSTLYGLLLANVLCLPMARKLMHRSAEELLNKTIAVAGVLAIQAGDNPRIVELKLRAYLPAGAKLVPQPVDVVQPAASSPQSVRRVTSHAARLQALVGALHKLGLMRRMAGQAGGRGPAGKASAGTKGAAKRSGKLMEAA